MESDDGIAAELAELIDSTAPTTAEAPEPTPGATEASDEAAAEASTTSTAGPTPTTSVKRKFWDNLPASSKAAAKTLLRPKAMATPTKDAAQKATPPASSKSVEQPSKEAAVVKAPEIQLQPCCGKCKTPVDAFKAPVIGKSNGS